MRTGSGDLHSGVFGNAGLNAIHALIQCLSAILPRDGRLPEPLRAGIAEPSAEEVASWATLKPGAELLADAGIAPYDERAAEEFYRRTWAEPSAEINGIQAGKPIINTTLISSARANFTLRLAPGQDPDEIAAAVRRLIEEATPAGAEVELTYGGGAPGPGSLIQDAHGDSARGRKPSSGHGRPAAARPRRRHDAGARDARSIAACRRS